MFGEMMLDIFLINFGKNNPTIPPSDRAAVIPVKTAKLILS